MYNYKTIIFDLDGILYDGTINMLHNLKKENYTLCICTNCSKEYIEEILDTFDIRKYFTIIKSKVQGLTKAQLIKQTLDESSSCSAIIVGSRAMDFEVADNTSCLSIGISYGRGQSDYKAADFTAEHPMDIHRLVKKINEFYKDIAKQILQKKQKDLPLLVGINGVDTSGKTTFTKELSRYISKMGFKTQTILMDDFHNPSQIRNKERDAILSYINNAFDLSKIENEILGPIAKEGILDKELTLLDLEEDKFTKCKRYFVDKDTIVLVEGVLLYREPLNKYFHLRLFMDISFDEVLERAKKRDGALFGDKVIERYRTKYIPIQKLYIEKYDPKGISDIIIDNEDYNNPKIIKGIACDKSKGEKIGFENIQEKHMTEITKMLEDDDAREMVGVVTFPSLEDYKGNNNICYAILVDQQQFVGVVELFNISWKNRRAELSITIKPSMRGKGYGHEAVKKILELGFEVHGINRIWLRVLETNKKAINLYEKLGFVQEGICRGESLRGGKFINQIQMSMLFSEWIGGEGYEDYKLLTNSR